MRVAQHLDLDVPRLFHEFLNEHAIIAETVACFVAAGGEAFEGLFVVECHAQALAPPTGTGLDHHGIADALSNLYRRFGGLDGGVMPRNRVHLRFGS